MIGVVIAMECCFSILSYIQLQFMMERNQSRIRLLHPACLILVLMRFSEVPLCLRVRELWVQHMPVTMQILQYVPSLVQIIHSLVQGTYSVLYIMCWSPPPIFFKGGRAPPILQCSSITGGYEHLKLCLYLLTIFLRL